MEDIPPYSNPDVWGIDDDQSVPFVSLKVSSKYYARLYQFLSNGEKSPTLKID